ncbi:MAG: tRNA-dihydrouridine synthase family protein [Treponema sp.]|jgi:tRNA-dihydrouridine synthase|nr:tRNA-dihydrouridine synthase family protein [Treponema sp.]
MIAPFMLAPMSELSHRALRELVHDFGACDCYFTEMISAGALLGGGPFEAWYLDGGPCPEKLVYQLAGKDPEQIAGAAALLDRRECAGIDINMGCSAPAIRKIGAGVAWMSSVDKAGSLMDRLRKTTKKRLSVKLRIGFEDDFEYLAAFCRRLEQSGTELIVLHPRTAREKLKRLARWDYVEALRRELHIPVAGNGDIASAKGLVERDSRAAALSGASGPHGGLMVGRAAVRQPWIFAHARRLEAGLAGTEPGTELVLRTGLLFLELLSRHQPPEFHLSRARRFFSLFCDNLKWGNYLKTRINREDDLAGIERVWAAYFSEQAE